MEPRLLVVIVLIASTVQAPLGTGNIDAEPMFVDPDNDDFRLQTGSPCIDAGHNWGVGPDYADLNADSDTAELTPSDLDGTVGIADFLALLANWEN